MDPNGNWHTANETFAKIEYHPGPSGSERTADWWEAWDKAGTKYVFDLNALIWDGDNTPNGLTTNKWMLHTVTDVHNNIITYGYRWEEKNGTTQSDDELAPPYRTRAVYPRQITYGAGGDKIRVDFLRASRTDYWDADEESEIYMGQRITGIEVKRLIAPSTYTTLRTYEFVQDYSIDYEDKADPPNHYAHLTLKEIVQHGQGGQSRLPSTWFAYYQGTESFASEEDEGHLYQAHNGYGGEVRYYYDAAAADLNSGYRRVRAKRVLDGMGDFIVPSGVSTVHNALYAYDYRGATTNTRNVSAEAGDENSKALHFEDEEFRGFAWAREQNSSSQVIDHYFNQDDALKAKEYRSQVGKAIDYSYAMTDTPGTNSNWTVVGSVTPTTEPSTTNAVWKTSINSSISRNVSTGVITGSDVSLRVMIKRGDVEDTAYRMIVTDTLRNANNNGEYWGVQIGRIWNASAGAYQYDGKIVWAVVSGGNLVTGSRDISKWASTPLQPYRLDAIVPDEWYWIRLHTSPDGRFLAELHRDERDYIAIKSSDALPGGGTVPMFPLGATWKFKHEVSATGTNFDYTLIDDYSEIHTIYSQSDSTFGVTSISAASVNYNQTLVGLANNCDGMNIRFTPLTESLGTIYGLPPYQLGQERRVRTVYEYSDTYGNQTAVKQYGNASASGDERAIHTTYHNNTSAWILGKPKYTRVYSSTEVSDIESNTYLLAKTITYYDGNNSNPDTLPSDGDVTKVEQVGVLNGVLETGVTTNQLFEYDGYGNQTKVTDPRGNHTSTGYDEYYHSFPVVITYPNTTKQYTGFDYTLDAVSAITDVNGTVTKNTYDVFGRPLKTWIVGFGDVDNPNESYKFIDSGQYTMTAPIYISYTLRLDSTTGPNTHSFGLRWLDGRGRTLQEITPRDTSHVVKVDTFYNSLSQVVSTTMPYETSYSYPPTYGTTSNQPATTMAYDGIGRVMQTTNPDNTAVLYGYYLQVVGVANETQTQTKWTQTDLLGRTIQVLLESADSTPDVKADYAYDKLDRVLYTVRDAGGTNETFATIQYDALGRKSQMTDPDMGTWQYEYDEAGNLTQQRDSLYLSNPTAYASHQITFTYDLMNRISAKYYGHDHWSAGIPDVKYLYDDALGDASTAKSWGKLRAAEVTLQGQGIDKANVHAYFYDARGLVVSEVVTSSLTTRDYTTQYAYDLAERVKTITYPDPEEGSIESGTHEQTGLYYSAQGIDLPELVIYQQKLNRHAGGER